MQSAPRITFHGFHGSPTLKALIEQHIGSLERYHPRLTGCHVTVEVPHRRHRKGRVWHVKVAVGVPGNEIVVRKEAEQSRRHEDPAAAVRDAFDQARRRLTEHRRRANGEVKAHGSAPVGRVDAVNGDHGFLSTDDGRSIYFHANSVLDGQFEALEPGARVTFVEEDGVEGPQASTIRVVDPTGAGARRAS